MFPGTFDTLVNVVSLLKETGLTPDHLEAEAAGAPFDEQAKLLDVAAIYRSYEQQLEGARLIDLGGVYHYLTAGCSSEEFLGVFRRVYPEVAALSLAGFDQFTPPEMDFLERLSGIPGVAVSLRFDFQHGNPRLFGHLEENYRRFLRLGFEETRATGPDQSLQISPLIRGPQVDRLVAAIAQGLFLGARSGHRHESGRRIRIIRARTRTDEIASICRIIKQLAASRPSRDLSAICVSMVRPQRYTEIIREQFGRFGIPANITDRYSLHRSPLIASIFAVLDMVLRDYGREDVLRVVRSPYLCLSDDIDAAGLARVASLLRITGGMRGWRERIERRRHDAHGGGESLSPAWFSPEQARRMLDRAHADINRVFELTAPLLGQHPPAAFESRLVKTLEALNVPARLLAGMETADIERDVRAYARFLEVLHETAKLLELQDGASRKQSLRSMTETLRLAVMRERFNVREEHGGGVLVTSIDETRGLNMEVMFVVGLVDGEFPSAYEPEVFLSARRQQEREQWHRWQERYLFYQGVTNWTESLWVTYPAQDGDLELVRSPFVDALGEIVSASVTEADSLPEALCSQEEVLSWHVREGSSLQEKDGADASLSNRLREIQRVVEIERSRVVGHTLPQFEGRIGGTVSHPARTWLEGRREAVFSVSQLETYANCPFRYFGERFLRLEPVEEFSDEWTHRERGALVHKILYAFHIERRSQALPPIAQCDEREFDHARRRLLDIAEEALSEIDVPDPFWSFEREQLLGLEGGRKGVLEELLSKERERSTESVPRFFEVTFGGGGEIRDPEIDWPEPITVGDMRLRGRIDRLDLAEDHFTVVDYKTGAVLPGVRDLEQGYSLQLPLYLEAAGRILAGFGYPRLTPAAGVYVQVRRPVRVRLGLGNKVFLNREFTAREGARVPVETTDALRERCAQSARHARRCVDGIAAGEFPLTDPSRAAVACRPCPLKTICRIQATRRVGPAESEEA